MAALSDKVSGAIARTPLRTRITLWVLGSFAVVHATLSLLVVLYQREYMLGQVEANLVAATHTVAGDQTPPNPDDVLLRTLQDARASRWGPLALVMMDSTGGVLATAGAHGPEELGGVLDARRAAGLSPDQPHIGQSEQFIFVERRLPWGHVLLVAAPRREIARTLNMVTLVLLLALPVGLLSTGISTWFVAGLVLRPIQQVEDFAHELSPDAIPRSIDLKAHGPEIDSLRNELQEAMGRIEAGYDAQTRFLATISHELKTPISVLRTEADVLLSGTPSHDDLERFAQSTSEEMRRLARMLEGFLVLARVRRKRHRTGPHKLAANDLLTEVAAQCHTMARQNDVTLVPTLFENDPPPRVDGDADLLRSALDNIVRNAIRVSPPGRSVEMSCRVQDGTVVYRVRDYGPGVAAHLIDTLFEPQTDGPRRGRSGLGLQIAQGVAELHSGRIDVRNLDEGCVFSLHLPLAAQPLDGT